MAAGLALAMAVTLVVVVVANGQPRITSQPTDEFVNMGEAAELRFAASSTSPYTNQWFFNSVALADATNSFLRFTNAQPSLSGDYFAVRSDASGSVTSQIVRLKVFVSAPHAFSSLAIGPGKPATLSLTGETTALFGPYYDLYPVEVSSNLVDWSPLVTLQRTNAAIRPLTFVDTNAPHFDRRFYRVPTNQLRTPLPPLTGPYAVGTFSRLLTDFSRTNTVRRTNHQFMVTIWYPAIRQAGTFQAPYLERQLANKCQAFFAWAGFANLAPEFVGHSGSDLPLATDQSSWPVVLYSPSAGSYRRENISKVEELASHGFIVIGLDHRTTYASLFPDGRVVYATASVSESDMSSLLNDLQQRALDERFVIDHATQWNADDPFFGGHLDLQRVGAFGFSIGGATAAELCRTDSRCKAGIGMDGWFLNTNLLTTPFLMFRADTPDVTKPDGKPDDRRSVIQQMTNDAYLARISGTVHWSHSDMPMIADKATMQSLFGGQTVPDHPVIDGVRVNQIVSTYVVSFFKKYLRGDDDHLLDGPPSHFPEVIEFYRK